jgi:anaerobic magnesium-protoporphyrin IX monomethyl ester cyclase
MRVLMLMPPYIQGFMRNGRWESMTISGSQWYPIFMSYATGLLEREGHEVKLIDAQVDRLTREQVYKIAADFMPQLTVVYFSMKSLRNDVEITDAICALTGSDSVFVGSSSSFDPPKTLGISYRVNKLIKGEFDISVLDLANKRAYVDISGLVWKDRDGIHENPQGKLVTGAELDGYPFVTSVYKKHLNMKNYWLSAHYNPYVDLFTGRGCQWGLCSYCLWNFTMYKGIGDKYRPRSVGNVIEELKYIKSELPLVKDVYLQDDYIPEERICEISQAILDNNIKMRWSGYSRANLKLETLKLMRKSGCYLLEVGFESANPQILKNIKKGITVDTMEKFAIDAHKAGIVVVGSFITGLPGETVESIHQTIDWLNRMPILRYNITLPKVYQGTALWDELNQKGWLVDGKPNYPELSTEEIYCWNKWSLRHSYLSLHFLRKILFRPADWGRTIKSAYYFMPFVLSKKENTDKKLEW